MIFIVKIEKHRKDSAVYFSIPFETEYATIDELHAALAAGQIVKGSQLIYERQSKIASTILGRRPFFIGQKEVISIQVPQQKFLEPEAAPQ